VAQGIAYLDLGFIDPALLAAIVKTAKDGHLVTRVAMNISALARLQQQIQQVLVGLREARQPRLVSALLSNGTKSDKSGA
jgi:hypothetical protein